MAALENRKHELFAQALAKGENASSAYRASGYSATGNSAEAAASRLLSDVKVQARVAELQERAAIRTEKTVADLVTMLEEDRILAREVEQPSAAISAVMGMGKLLGLVKDKTELTGKDGAAIEINQKVREDADAVTSAIAGLVERARASGMAEPTQH